MELLIPLDSRSKKPLYEQIYSHIRAEIRNGSLKAGERLPSTRVLAEHLKVSRSTTQMAYDQLLAEGYMEARPCNRHRGDGDYRRAECRMARRFFAAGH